MAPITSQLLLATLTGSAIAAVSHKRHAELHKRQATGVNMPYGFNSTGNYYAATTGAVKVHTNTEHVKHTKTIYVTDGAASSPAAAPAYAQKEAAAPSSPADTCPSVVTVTATAVSTVTVTAGELSGPSSTAAASTTPVAAPQPAVKDVQDRGHGHGHQNQQPSSSSPAAPVAAPTTKQQAAPVYSQPPVYSQASDASSQPAAYSKPAASASSSAAAAASSPAVCKRGVSGKKGCASTKGNRTSCESLNQGGAGMAWIYDWEAGETDLGDMEYVPMLHGIEQMWLDWFATSPSAKTAKYAMLPNEPMISGQAGPGLVSAAQIDNIYSVFKNAIGSTTKILSPSMCGNQNGIDWLLGFDSNKYDIINAHYYEDCTQKTDASGLQAYLSSIKSQLPGKQIWLTELGCHRNPPTTMPTPDQISDFMKAVIPVVESEPSIDRYSWYMADATDDQSYGFLTNADHSVNSLGSQYSTAGCA